MEGIKLEDIKMEGVSLEDIKTEGVNLDDIKTEGVNLDDIKTEGVNLDDIKAEGGNLEDIEMEDLTHTLEDLKLEDTKNEEDVISNGSQEDGWDDEDEESSEGDGEGSFDWKATRDSLKASDSCWICFLLGTFFCCKGCGRNYHRNCALMSNGYPRPVFDKTVEEACKAEKGQVALIKCSVCLVSEETRFPLMKNVPKDELNRALFLTGGLIKAKYVGSMLNHIETNEPSGLIIDRVLNKANDGVYNSAEGFFHEFRQVYYNIVMQHSTSSEAGEVAKMVNDVASLELAKMVFCVQCTLRRFDNNGKLLSARSYEKINTLDCKVPHLVVWMKEPTYPFWPTKVFSLDPGTNRIFIQCFGEKPEVRPIPFPGALVVRTFSNEYPADKRRINKDKKWKAALRDCRQYFDNLRKRFGDEGVVIPESSDEFTGDLGAVSKKMFPLYYADKEKDEESSANAANSTEVRANQAGSSSN